MHKRLLIISAIFFCSIIAPYSEAGGIDTSSSTYSISKSPSSSVTGTSDAFDNSNSTDLRLVADTINGGCFGGHAIITYQLSLVSSSIQNLSMTHYSQTNYQGIGQGWSTLSNLEMWVNVTDSNGNKQLWFSSTPDNQISPSTTTSSLGEVVPYSNSSVELVIGIQHDNSFGSESDCIGILEIYEIWSEPEPVAPEISYSPNVFEFTKGNPIQNIQPNNVGDAATSWTINPELPSGLSFSESTGAISGTPNQISSSSIYNITATNDHGSDVSSITLSVVDDIPSFSYEYENYTFNQGTDIGSISPTSTGGEITSWTHECLLPSGIEFNSSNGHISGTPIALTSVQCKIIASNSGGSSNVSINLEVIIAPPLLELDSEIHTFIVGYSNNSIVIINSGGAVSSWELIDDLPSGLNLSNGLISGTPTNESEASSYQIKASNLAGDDVTTVIIKVVLPSPIFEYNNLLNLTKGQVIDNLVPTIIQGHSTNWTIIPDLPSGLMLNPITGVISGTPAIELQLKSYIISASNSQGQFEQSISIEIKEDDENANINTGSGDDKPEETSNDDSDEEKSWIEEYYLFIVLLAILLSLFLIVKRKDDQNQQIPPVLEVHHHHEKEVVHHHHEKEIKETFVIKEFKEIAQPKSIDMLAEHIKSNIVGEEILQSSKISDFDKDCKFEKDQFISMKIMAARAYPTKGNIAMTKKEAIRKFTECWQKLVEGPATGASISPSVGAFVGDETETIDWDQSYCLDLKASVYQLLIGNTLTNYIQSIREFIHSICSNYLQDSVLFMVEPTGLGGLANMLDENEKQLVTSYQEKSDDLYGYITMAELEKLVIDINKSNNNNQKKDNSVNTHQ